MSPNKPAALMLQGIGSNVGKSLLTAGLLRAYANRGLAVRPFKPQNMSNNAAVTYDGGEIGRAQALQARAARVRPSIHMNPVLLKPQSEIGAQVIVQGAVRGAADARAYHHLKPRLMAAVLDSYRRLGRGADLILVEGAGSWSGWYPGPWGSPVSRVSTSISQQHIAYRRNHGTGGNQADFGILDLTGGGAAQLPDAFQDQFEAMHIGLG